MSADVCYFCSNDDAIVHEFAHVYPKVLRVVGLGTDETLMLCRNCHKKFDKIVFSRYLPVIQKIAKKLNGDDLMLTQKELVNLFLVPLEKIERFTERIIIGPNGKPIYIK